MKNKQILVIEDNIDIRENIIELLHLTGYQAIGAADGREGAKLALEHLPDLILCDIMMPVLDGYGVLHVLSKHRETLNTPFIFLSAKAERSDVRKGMTLGADDYITKPFDETDLLTAVENRLLKAHKDHSFEDASDNNDFMKIIFENKEVKSYGSKEFIYREEDTPRKLYYLQEGKVKTFKSNRDEKEVVLELCSKGDFFGYWGILEGETYNENAQAIDEVTIYEIPIDHFKKLLNSNSNVSTQFLKLLSNNLLLKENKMLELAYESVRKRVANSVVAIYDVYADINRCIDVPRDLIATMAGTSVASAIRMLSEFKNSGLISISHDSIIKVLDYEKLKNAPF